MGKSRAANLVKRNVNIRKSKRHQRKKGRLLTKLNLTATYCIISNMILISDDCIAIAQSECGM